MEHLNTFKSLKQDVSKFSTNTETALNIVNFRPFTDEGGTTGSLVNIKGNEIALTIPCVSNVWRIDPSDTTLMDGDVYVTIEIAGLTAFALNIGMPSTIEEFCKKLAEAINNDVSLQTLGFKAFYYDTYVLIIATNNDYMQFDITSVQYNGEMTEDETVTLVSTYDCSLSIIGWKRLRDDIYIFTTSCSTDNPGGVDPSLTADPRSLGQIWKFTYDDQIPLSSTSPSLELIYNNYLNFTIKHPIPEVGGAVSIYEDDKIQRLYWTEYFNNVRTLNVADDNAFAFPVEKIDLKPEIGYSIPTLDNIIQTGGKCKSGIYQLSYRYYNLSGGKTSFFIPSHPIHIVDDSEEGTSVMDYYHYDGTNNSSTTSKQIRWNISDLDINFQYVELAVLYRETYSSTPDIFLAGIMPVTNSIFFTFSGQNPDTQVTITLDEFIEKNYSFDIAKSIDQKNNFLFAANTKSKVFDIEYDAKAFRFHKISNDTYILDNAGDPYSTIPSLSDTHEINNPYNNDVIHSWDINDSRAYKYQFNKTTLGGEGNNIKYSFITEDNLCDQNAQSIRVGLTKDPVSESWSNHKSPYNVQKKGYKRNEIYRFGIVFFNKSGNPGFVKWIDDIRIPGVYDYANDGSAALDADFPLAYTVYNNNKQNWETYCRQIGLRFDVNIPSNISNQISGFSIVRCKREDKDKTILGQGIIDPAVINDAGPSNLLQFTPGGTLNHSNTYGTPMERDAAEAIYFTSPDFIFKPYPGLDLNSDRIVPVSAMKKFAQGLSPSTGPTAVNFYHTRYIEHGRNPGNYATIGSGCPQVNYNNANAYIGLDPDSYISFEGSSKEQHSIISGINTLQAVNYGESDSGNLYSVGGKTMMFGITIGADYGSIPGYEAIQGFSVPLPNNQVGFALITEDKWIADYYRENTGRYGGTGYYYKTLNEYITCGQFQPVVNSDSDVVYSVDVWGGDTITQLFTHTRAFGWWYNKDTASVDLEDIHTIYTFPVESEINVQLRSGYYYNKTYLNDSTSTYVSDFQVSNYKEDYIYNFKYSNENDAVKYFHKPYNYIDHKVYEIHDNRIWASQQKINGEAIDSWSIFKSADYRDVDGIYGPINNLIRFKDRLFFFQDDAVGVLSSGERVMVDNTNNEEVGLALGIGTVLQRHDYLSTDIGCKHQFSTILSDSSIYWFDVKTLKLYRLGEGIQPISELGLSAYLKYNVNNHIRINDNPYLRTGITGTYNRRFNEVYFTFLDYYTIELGSRTDIDKSFTLVYNELSNDFTSFYSFTPSVYINDRKNIFSTENYNITLYMHDVGEYCNFYGNTYPSKLSYISNPFATETKTFNNLEITSEAVDNNSSIYDTMYPYIGFDSDNVTSPNIVDATFDSIRIYNDYQNTDYQLLNAIAKRKERTWNLIIPRNRVIYNTTNDNIFTSTNLTSPNNKSFGERMRDKYIIVDLIYNNLYNYKFIVNSIKTLYEKSIR